MSDFLARVSRYARPALAVARENRLTNNFEAVLREPHTDGLALDIVRAWLAAPGAGGIRASWEPVAAALAAEDMALRDTRTQCFTTSGKFVDLELRFAVPGGAPADDITVWVEAKHGTGPGDEQLPTYVTDLGMPGRRGVVVLLAPRADYPFMPEPPEQVAQCTWQQTAVSCAAYVATCEDPVGRWLTRALLDFLEVEGLMDPPAVTTQQFDSIDEHRRALASLAAVVRIGSAHIKQAWGPRTGPTRGPHKRPVTRSTVIEAFETHAPSARYDWSPAFMDWNLEPSDRAYPASRGGVPVFIAGIGVSHPNSLFIADWAPWQERLLAENDFVSLTHGGFDRLVRVIYPRDVLSGDSIQEQGENLGRWVVQSYEALHDARAAHAAATAPLGP
ncbi:MAG: hypothetical protein WKF96_14690 [Solirubrobacteraceae bacterium]